MVVAQKSKNGGPVGKSVKRVDIFEKVSGSATFCDDIQFGTGLYHARAKRSPYPHALIKKIDVSKALVSEAQEDEAKDGDGIFGRFEVRVGA